MLDTQTSVSPSSESTADRPSAVVVRSQSGRRPSAPPRASSTRTPLPRLSSSRDRSKSDVSIAGVGPRLWAIGASVVLTSALVLYGAGHADTGYGEASTAPVPAESSLLP